ncbi:MAG: hypothetical protein U5O39_15490 [Gammaproteobacteria bacterium]|nr:hypothetical protein [Gammaproteobacteria bacterium]
MQAGCESMEDAGASWAAQTRVFLAVPSSTTTEASRNPMLGRYQVEKELGQGAMGVVYLGTDPRINREVAIKTMALSMEFADDELAEVKERFFREAGIRRAPESPQYRAIVRCRRRGDLRTSRWNC